MERLESGQTVLFGIGPCNKCGRDCYRRDEEVRIESTKKGQTVLRFSCFYCGWDVHAFQPLPKRRARARVRVWRRQDGEIRPRQQEP